VIVYSAFIMLVMGVFGKFSALLVSIPEPIVGGVFTVVFGKFNLFCSCYIYPYRLAMYAVS